MLFISSSGVRRSLWLFSGEGGFDLTSGGEEESGFISVREFDFMIETHDHGEKQRSEEFVEYSGRKWILTAT